MTRRFNKKQALKSQTAESSKLQPQTLSGEVSVTSVTSAATSAATSALTASSTHSIAAPAIATPASQDFAQVHTYNPPAYSAYITPWLMHPSTVMSPSPPLHGPDHKNTAPEQHLYPISGSPLTGAPAALPPSPPSEQHPSQAAEVKADPRGCLFVASLSSSRSDEQLHESVCRLFSQWGPLMDVKVMKDWANRPYAFVQYLHHDDAQRARVEANATLLDGRRIRIEQAKVNRTLFIAKFARYATREDLLQIVERYGPVEDIKMLHHYQTGQSKGCAFVKFKYREDAIKAFTNLRQNSAWVVEWAQNLERTEEAEVDKTSIFVGQLNMFVTEDALRERFGKYGSIQSVQLFKRATFFGEAPCSFAFIQYTSETAAQTAIENENNSVWMDTTLRVEYRETNTSRLQRHSSAPSSLSSRPAMPPMMFPVPIPPPPRPRVPSVPVPWYGASPPPTPVETQGFPWFGMNPPPVQAVPAMQPNPEMDMSGMMPHAMPFFSMNMQGQPCLFYPAMPLGAPAAFGMPMQSEPEVVLEADISQQQQQ